MPFLTKVPESDLYVAKLYPNTNFKELPSLNCGRYNSYLNIYRILMYFDISFLPRNICICNAVLKLYIKENPDENVRKTITIHELLQPFDESIVTYSNQPKFRDNPRVSFNIKNKINEFVQVNITDLLREWYSSPNSNYGMLIKTAETEFDFISFASTSDEDESKFPKLEIYYKYCKGLSSYPKETVQLLSSEDFVNSNSIPLGPNVGTFAIENKGVGAINVRIQLSSDNINWIDNKLPYVSNYILLKGDNIILTTTAYMDYARVLITHAENYPLEDAKAIIYKTVKV
ncbi:DNRLRE domain-containing protein [Clostridium tepidum]